MTIKDNSSLPGLELLWSAERQLMRLEALLAAMPNAALHWRSQVALIESVRSTEMNDYNLDPATLLLALMQQQAARSRSDAGAVRQAEAIWRTITSATGSEADFAAAAPVGGGGLLTIQGDDVFMDAVRPPDRIEWAMENIDKLGSFRSQPLLPRLAVVPHILREINGEPSPAAERLWMVLADQKWRRPDPIIHQAPTARRSGQALLDTPDQGRWIIAPASILSLKGPGLWNLGATDFRERFVRQADGWLRLQLDNLLAIARWEANQLLAFAQAGPNGARVHFTHLLARTPIVDAQIVARRLKVHERTARRLLNEAAEASVVTELTGRYQFRIWAAPSLALWAESTHQDRRKRLPRLSRSAGSALDDLGRDQEPVPQPLVERQQWSEEKAEKDARLQALMDELDALSKGAIEVSKRVAGNVEEKARSWKTDSRDDVETERWLR